jgi:hypothetical protein
MSFKEDWRLTNQMNYLYNARLKHKPYCPVSSEWDHDHCSFCFEKFKNPEQTGYCTLDNYHWICENCFQDFCEIFQWSVIDQP